MFVKDQAGLETDYQYDSLGRMTNVIKPLVFNPEGGTNANWVSPFLLDTD